MIILDYSQIGLANVFQFQNDLQKGRASPEAKNIIRHAVLTGIKYYKKKFGDRFGDIVISCDGRQYWRRDMFEYYKADRKKKRANSTLDWTLIFDTLSEIRDDLAEHFPYKVIHLENVESDDIIATICKWSQENGMVDHGMFEEKEPILIVSSDGDFKQLHKYDNVKQWNPILKKQVTCDDPAAYLLQHIAKAGDDGIPNVLSPDDVFVTEGTRQKKMTAQRLEEFTTMGRDACRNDTELRNWDRNNQLINFDMMPTEIEQKIVDTYNGTSVKGDKMSVYNYLVEHRCRLLLDEVEEF